ncbi:leucyl/phenylalanyl-tRNA--protein transferase, partial [Paraburkholderia sp. A1RI_3L]
VKMVARIDEVFDIQLRLRQAYLHPTIAELALSVLRCVLGAEEPVEDDVSVEEGRNLPLIAWLTDDMPLPDTSEALDAASGTPGLLAAEGGLGLARLKEGMSKGVFAMPLPGAPLMWWAPDPRMVLPIADFHMSRSLRRTLRRLRKDGCTIRVDTAFSRVWQACASVARSSGNGTTWISPEFGRSLDEWHREGGAHSFELWDGDELIGGVFCVALGRMISAESMFGLRTDASKIALASLVAFCRAHRIELVDTQLYTPHIASLGGREIPRARFEAHLQAAQREPAIDDWRFQEAFWDALLLTDQDAKS